MELDKKAMLDALIARLKEMGGIEIILVFVPATPPASSLGVDADVPYKGKPDFWKQFSDTQLLTLAKKDCLVAVTAPRKHLIELLEKKKAKKA